MTESEKMIYSNAQRVLAYLNCIAEEYELYDDPQWIDANEQLDIIMREVNEEYRKIAEYCDTVMVDG